MARKSEPKASQEQKVVTKYDRKMEQRKKQQEMDKRQAKRLKITGIVVGIALLATIAGAIIYSVYSRYDAVHGIYAKIGEHEISRLEYDYYYNTTVQNYLNSYGSFLSYMGLDAEGDFSEQMYSDTMTWKDMFDQMTMEQLQQMKALSDDMKKTGFSYDLTEEYKEYTNDLETAAKESGMQLSEYYKKLGGEHATPGNIKPYLEETMLASKYYNKLLEDHAATEDEITKQYEENPDQYDKIDYYSFQFLSGLTSEASEDEKAARMEELKAQAEAFATERKSGADFDELCAKYAEEEDKENYEDPDTEYSLQNGRYKSSMPEAVKEWLFAEERKAGDLEVLEDAEYNRYYVVEYVNRYFDEADRDGIGSTMAEDRVTEYIDGLCANYEIVDVKGELKYLLIPETP